MTTLKNTSTSFCLSNYTFTISYIVGYSSLSCNLFIYESILVTNLYIEWHCKEELKKRFSSEDFILFNMMEKKNTFKKTPLCRFIKKTIIKEIKKRISSNVFNDNNSSNDGDNDNNNIVNNCITCKLLEIKSIEAIREEEIFQAIEHYE